MALTTWIKHQIPPKFRPRAREIYRAVRFLEIPRSGKSFRSKAKLMLKYWSQLGQICRSLLNDRPNVVLVYVKSSDSSETLKARFFESLKKQVVCPTRICFQESRHYYSKFESEIVELEGRSEVRFQVELASAVEPEDLEWMAIVGDNEVLFPHAIGEFVRHCALNEGWTEINCVGSDAIYISTRQGSATSHHLMRGRLSPLEVACRPWLIEGLQFFRTSEVRKRAVVAEQVGGDINALKLKIWLNLAEGAQASIPVVLSGQHSDDLSSQRAQSLGNYSPIVSDYFGRFGWEPTRREFGFVPSLMSSNRELSKSSCSLPSVSIVIPSKESFEVIERCLRTLFENTTYGPGFDVYISDNGTQDPRVLALYSHYEKKYPNRFLAEIIPAPFNFNAQVNRGIRYAIQRSKSELVLLLNNDTEVIASDWLQNMALMFSAPQIAVVGAKLLYPDGRIQHAGVESAGEDIARHTGHFWKADSKFAEYIVQAPRECFAVTAACLLFRKSIFDKVGPFDETHVPNGFGDVDWSLRLRSMGYQIVYQPEATLIHHESLTRGQSMEAYERLVILQRWSNLLVRDPYSNPTSNRDGWHMPGQHRAFPAIDWNFQKQVEQEVGGAPYAQ